MTSYVDENGVHHPSADLMRRYKNWRPSHGMVGRDPQSALDEIVREFLQEKHDEATASREKILAFVAAEPRLFNQCWDRIERYEKQVTKYRHANNMRPFDWRLEKHSTIRGILRARNGKKVLPLTALDREKRAAMAQVRERPLAYEKFKTVKPIAAILGGERDARLFKNSPETVPADQLPCETWPSKSGARTRKKNRRSPGR